jgi:hypothetical protein
MRQLAERIRKARAARIEALSRADREAASSLLSEEARLLTEYAQAETDWLQP